MKTDLDSLMQSRNLDALLISGAGQNNPPMVYLTGGAHMSTAYLIKRRGAAPILFHRTMERDEAARSGLQTRNYEGDAYDQVLRQTGGDWLKATVARLQAIFASAGVDAGRVGIYGQSDAGEAFALYSALKTVLPGVQFVGELGDSLFLSARMTKDPDEIERIRRMGEITTQVVGQTADFLTSQDVKDGILIQADGSPLTIGAVKRRINLWLAECGADNPQGCIFAIGRDAGVPHSSGTQSDLLRLGQTIIFDIYPCEAGGGYYYDFTRTWCLGYAPDEALALYEDVYAVYHQLIGEMRLGATCKSVQLRACDLFEALGHATLRTNPVTENGFAHNLGHGLGLQIHERPFFRITGPDDDRLDANVVITVEPGLYYPERGMGVRLENTHWMRPDGRFELLAEYPMDFVLPMKK